MGKGIWIDKRQTVKGCQIRVVQTIGPKKLVFLKDLYDSGLNIFKG